MVTKTRLTHIFSIGRPMPDEAERTDECDTLRRKILDGPQRIDDVKRLNALEDLVADWGCKPLRVPLYKLLKDDD